MSEQISVLLGHERKLRAYIHRKSSDRAHVEDVYQEVLLRVIEQSRKQDIANVLAYAYRVADSVIFAQARKFDQVELSEETALSELPLADEILQSKERSEIFRRALANLTPLQREVFLKRHLDGKSRQTIAKEMSMSVEAVKKHLMRSMGEMARAVESQAQPVAAGIEQGGRKHDR